MVQGYEGIIHVSKVQFERVRCSEPKSWGWQCFRIRHIGPLAEIGTQTDPPDFKLEAQSPPGLKRAQIVRNVGVEIIDFIPDVMQFCSHPGPPCLHWGVHWGVHHGPRGGFITTPGGGSSLVCVIGVHNLSVRGGRSSRARGGVHHGPGGGFITVPGGVHRGVHWGVHHGPFRGGNR
jgi:hypothetical protein